MKLSGPHATSLETSTALSNYYVANFIAPLAVVGVLNGAGVRSLLVGTHALGGWMQEPRATKDVDVLVAARSHKKAVKALLAAFPELEANDEEAAAGFRLPQTESVLIDLLKPNQPLLRVSLEHTCTVRSGNQSYQIPSLEMALAMKFASLSSLTWREAKKYLDIHDFMQMVNVNPAIDLDRLANFGDLIYPGGGKEIVEKVRQVRAGEKLNL
jgi:hypothetical protein